MSVRTAAFCLGTLVLPIASSFGQPAPAPSASCDVVEVGATTEKAPSIDPELKPLAARLKKVLGAQNSYKQLSRQSTSLAKNKPDTLALKNGKATVMLRDRAKSHFEVTISLDDSGGKRWVNNTQAAVDGGDWLMFAHDAPNNAAHLVALTCK